MFDDATVRDFLSRYPNLTADDINRAIAWIERKDRENTLVAPLAMLESMCRKLSDKLPRLRAHEERTQPARAAARGSFDPDGHWNKALPVASETECALVEFAKTVARLQLSPAESVAVLERLPLVRACYRAGPWYEPGQYPLVSETRVGGPIGVMLRLDAKPIPGTPGAHEPIDWIVAAWANVHTSTSTEEFVKRSVLRTLAPTA